jgi:hypothetical protein
VTVVNITSIGSVFVLNTRMEDLREEELYRDAEEDINLDNLTLEDYYSE